MRGVSQLERAFAVCTDDTWRGIGESTFNGCPCLTSVAIPRKVTSIGAFAFHRCPLTTVDLPETVDTIGAYAFSHSGLTSIRIPRNLTWIADGAFQESQLRSIVLPPTIQITTNVFNGCRHLESVAISDGVFLIESGAFARTALTSVEIPKSVSRLSHRAFAECNQLVVATVLGTNVMYFLSADSGNVCNVFMGCRNLKYVVAPSMLRSPGQHTGCVPVMPCGALVDDTPSTRLAALRLQYWSRPTHRLCAFERRQWVVTVILCARRLTDRGQHMPSEMWAVIMGFIRRCDLG
eukprot:m.474759 g.474759  ORF g.474759 m.474759 type:complete len:293 (+) comp36885_c0_seq1:341-1219(+)